MPFLLRFTEPRMSPSEPTPGTRNTFEAGAVAMSLDFLIVRGSSKNIEGRSKLVERRCADQPMRQQNVSMTTAIFAHSQSQTLSCNDL
jgi:hypothetical protein